MQYLVTGKGESTVSIAISRDFQKTRATLSALNNYMPHSRQLFTDPAAAVRGELHTAGLYDRETWVRPARATKTHQLILHLWLGIMFDD